MRQARCELEEKFTLDEAYDYGPGDRKGASLKGLMAVAYPLDSITDVGNEDLEGQIASGLAYVLRHFAGEVNDLVNPVQFRDLKWEFEKLQERCNASGRQS